MFESNEGADELILTIVESGHMLVSQGQELLVSKCSSTMAIRHI